MLPLGSDANFAGYIHQYFCDRMSEESHLAPRFGLYIMWMDCLVTRKHYAKLPEIDTVSTS